MVASENSFILFGQTMKHIEEYQVSIVLLQ